MSLRWKIALALGALAAAATMAVGIASYRTTRDRLYAEIDRSLLEAVSLLPTNPRGEVGVPVRGPLALYEAQVLDRNGEVRLTTVSDAFDPSDAAESTVGRPRLTVVETVSVDGSSYRVRTVGLREGAVQVVRPLTEIDRVLDSLRARTLLLVAIVTSAAVAIGLLVAGGVTASLRRLTTAATTVAETGRLDVVVPAEGSDEVGRLGSAFERMLGALARSRTEQQRLVQDAGHELRTPLTSMRTNLDVLRRHPDLPADQRAQVIDDLHSETEELVQLVNEIVAVASGAADDEPVSDFVLGDAATEIAERYQRRTGRSVRVQADESVVRAQSGAVQRAISNLLDNARKFDTSGGPIDVRVADGTLEVLDRGPGISAEDLPHVFERFHRATEARSMPGSGLGLSIVLDVVARQGGAVSASNRDGGGAVVGFRLPLTDDGSGGSEVAPAASDPFGAFSPDS
jgi:two-component system sensor histidine kinase MprB